MGRSAYFQSRRRAQIRELVQFASRYGTPKIAILSNWQLMHQSIRKILRRTVSVDQLHAGFRCSSKGLRECCVCAGGQCVSLWIFDEDTPINETRNTGRMIASQLQIQVDLLNLIIILFTIIFKGMTSTISLQQDSKMNDTLSGKIILKIKDIDNNQNKQLNITDKKVSNLEELIKMIEDRFTTKTANNEVLIIVDEKREEIEFSNDEEVTKFLEKKPTIMCIRVPIEQSKRVRKLMQTEKVEVQSELRENNILGNQLLEDNQSISKELKKEEKVEFSVIKEENTSEMEVVEGKSVNANKIFESILSEPNNLRKIAQLLQNQVNSSSQPVMFDLSCSFCKKSQLCKKIYACEMKLSVISCQECSPFLHYRIPFPFKAFTNPKRYQTELSSQSPAAISTFNDHMRVQRSMRNRTLKEKLSKLSLQA